MRADWIKCCGRSFPQWKLECWGFDPWPNVLQPTSGLTMVDVNGCDLRSPLANHCYCLWLISRGANQDPTNFVAFCFEELWGPGPPGVWHEGKVEGTTLPWPEWCLGSLTQHGNLNQVNDYDNRLYPPFIRLWSRGKLGADTCCSLQNEQFRASCFAEGVHVVLQDAIDHAYRGTPTGFCPFEPQDGSLQSFGKLKSRSWVHLVFASQELS